MSPNNQNNQNTPNNQKHQSAHLFLPQHGHYRNLRVYRVAEALYDITYVFCKRFLPSRGDRTVDQMIQAARSGKQNIAEGNQAGATSSETEIKLTNVARASFEELLVDYEDYLRTRSLQAWDMQHPRLRSMRQWTRSDLFFEEYATYAQRLGEEEMANLGVTLCHQVIYMLGQLLKTLQERFVEQGGIKERMYEARTGYRQQQDEMMKTLKQENTTLKQENTTLKQENTTLKQENTTLKQENTTLKQEIALLKKQISGSE